MMCKSKSQIKCFQCSSCIYINQFIYYINFWHSLVTVLKLVLPPRFKNLKLSRWDFQFLCSVDLFLICWLWKWFCRLWRCLRAMKIRSWFRFQDFQSNPVPVLSVLWNSNVNCICQYHFVVDIRLDLRKVWIFPIETLHCSSTLLCNAI